MTAPRSAATARSEPTVAIAVCAGIHILADWILISQPWFLADEFLVATLALPISQCSLGAIWAATSRSSPYLRFAVPVVSVIACWFVVIHCSVTGTDERGSAGWAIALATQTLAIVVAIEVYRRIVHRGSTIASEDRGFGVPNVFAFDLRTLMLWTTVFGVGFGFVQFGRVEWSWSAAVAQWRYFRAMPVIGLFNTAVALLWLWATWHGQWRWRPVKVVAAALLVGVSGYALAPLLAWITGFTTISTKEGLVLLSAQSVYLVASLAVVAIVARRFAVGLS